MRRLAIFALPLLAACNPAVVGPAEPANKTGNETANETGNPIATQDRNDASAPAGEEPGFSAMGQVRCVTRAGWAVRDCTAGVLRGPDRGAVVTIFHPEGRSRDILFDAAGRASGVRTAEADGSDRQSFSASRQGNVTVVRLGPERYEIPDALVAGR